MFLAFLLLFLLLTLSVMERERERAAHQIGTVNMSDCWAAAVAAVSSGNIEKGINIYWRPLW